jgi:hypothetical protein
VSSTIDAPPQPRDGVRWRLGELLGWIAFFAAARLALVLAFGDVFAYLEEFEKAAAAKALLDGVALAHHQLAYHPYEGGGFVVSHLDALAFALLGESVLAVKLVAVALGALLLALGWRLCQVAGGVAGGLAAARAFALLYVLAPASFQQNSLLALGIHYHALIFVAAVLLGVLGALEGGAHLRRLWFATGLAAGAGFFFSYQLALTILVAAGALVVVARRFGAASVARGAPWALAGGLLGLAPLFWMASHWGAAVFDIHGADVLATKVPKSELLEQFARSLFAGRSPLDTLSLALLLAAPFVLVFAMRSTGALRTLAWLVTAHLALFVVAYLGLGFTVGRVVNYFLLHRLAPLWFLGLVGASLGVAALWRTGRTRVAAAVVIVLAACGARDLGGLLAAASPHDWLAHARVLARAKGYAYPQYIQKLSTRLPQGRVELAELFLGFDEEDGEQLVDALAATVYGDGRTSLEEAEAEARELKLSSARPLIAGMGMALRNQWGGTIASRLAALEAQPPERRAALAEAIGRFGNRYFPTVDAVQRELGEGLAANAPPEFYFGLGMRMAAARGDGARKHYHEPAPGPWAFDAERARAVIDAQPAEVASALRAGYEHGTALQRLDGRDASRR